MSARQRTVGRGLWQVFEVRLVQQLSVRSFKKMPDSFFFNGEVLLEIPGVVMPFKQNGKFKCFVISVIPTIFTSAVLLYHETLVGVKFSFSFFICNHLNTSLYSKNHNVKSFTVIDRSVKKIVSQKI